MSYFTTLLFWGMLTSTLGKLLLGITVLLVHHKVAQEHKIDKVVITELKHEYKISILAICLIVIGFIIETIHFAQLGAL